MDLNPAQLAAFEKHGYLRIPALFFTDEIDVLRRGLDEIKAMTDRPEIVRERACDSVRLVYVADRFHDTWRRLVHHPRWIGPSRQLLTGDIYLHQLRINSKTAFDGQGWWWHQDYATWRFEDGMLSPRALMIGVFLNDMTPANGPLMVIPGSQKLGHIEDTARDHDKTGYTVMDLPRDLIEKLHARGRRRGGDRARRHGAVHALQPGARVGRQHHPPFERTIAYLNVASCDNPTTRMNRPAWFCNRDHAPLRALGDDALNGVALEAAG